MSFIVPNFFLFFVSTCLIILVARDFKTNKGRSLLAIIILSFTLLLAGLTEIEIQGPKHPELLFLTTLAAMLGYVIRPLVIYFFLHLVTNKRKVFLIFGICLIINFLIYSTSLFIHVPAINHLTFYYELSPDGSTLIWQRGSFLNFSSHAIAAVFISYLVIQSFSRLKGQHRSDATIILVSAAFVAVAVILEATAIATNLLNTCIALTCLFFYFHLYQQSSIRDALTGLYDRKSYYRDIAKMDRNVHGIIQVDMNALKYINDNEGHDAGDKALQAISYILSTNVERSMYVYRMGGDEFLIVTLSPDEEMVKKSIARIKAEMAKTSYHVAIGYAMRNDKSEDIDTLSKRAEEEMYKEKAAFYEHTNMERRRQLKEN